MAGYSPNPLVKKLGIKDGAAGLFVNVPPHLVEIATFPGFTSIESKPCAGGRDRDYVHWFSKSRDELESNLARVIARLKADGILWISWPK
jgi:hypothetical protein